MSSETMDHSDSPRSILNWPGLVLGTILAMALIIFVFKGCKGSNDSDMESTETVVADTAVAAPVELKRESMKVKLPDGSELDAYRSGIEDQLISFLNDATSKPGKDVWFDFDNLNFKTGSADITDESKVQIQNIAAILKAYPKVKIKIGGYTDKTGDSLNNLKLSQSRADAVESALKASGVNAAQLVGAEGYGSQYATVSASASDDERKKDRRISVSVRAK
jgi:outer membrane protein OmpA-like peptidoglycan-associated protein